MADETQYIELPTVEIHADSWEENPDRYTTDSADDRSGKEGLVIKQDTKGSVTGSKDQPEQYYSRVKFLDAHMKNLATRYGNNIFSLTIPNADCAIYGVLTEIPDISMSCEWQLLGPTMIQNALMDLQNDATFQTVTTMLGVKQLPVILGGSSTSRGYKQPNRPSFKLSFRIYARQAIGPATLSGYRRAMALLSAYASPLHSTDAENSFDVAVTNLGGILVEALAVVTDAGQATLNKIHNEKFEGFKTPFLNNAKKAFDQGSDAFNNFRSGMAKSNAKDAATEFKAGFGNLADAIQTLASGPTNSVLHLDSRVDQPVNYQEGLLGGAVWYLTILPGLINGPIPVFVESWSAKPSKEIDSDGQTSYYDFTITCTMDQIKSGSWWGDSFFSDDYVNYKALQKQYAEHS